MPMNPDNISAPEPGVSPVTVYWRPGCPYCWALRRQLRRLGIRTTEVDIWSEPAGAAVVRARAGGNETVPTVVIRGTAMVNPTGSEVLAVVRQIAPEALAEPQGPAGALRRWARARLSQRR